MSASSKYDFIFHFVCLVIRKGDGVVSWAAIITIITCMSTPQTLLCSVVVVGQNVPIFDA